MTTPMLDIPLSRAVLGQDLEAVREAYGWAVSDALWAFGLSITKWTRVVKQGAIEPIENPTLALLVRLLAMAPSPIIPEMPSVASGYEAFRKVDEDVKHKKFSVLLGATGTAAKRWLDKNARIQPATAHLMHLLILAMAEEGQGEAFLARWADVVAAEGRNRGIVDVLKTGNWNPEKP